MISYLASFCMVASLNISQFWRKFHCLPASHYYTYQHFHSSSYPCTTGLVWAYHEWRNLKESTKIYWKIWMFYQIAIMKRKLFTEMSIPSTVVITDSIIKLVNGVKKWKEQRLSFPARWTITQNHIHLDRPYSLIVYL